MPTKNVIPNMVLIYAAVDDSGPMSYIYIVKVSHIVVHDNNIMGLKPGLKTVGFNSTSNLRFPIVHKL